MKINEILNESHSSPLYHMMNYQKASNVFKNDTMIARWEHEIPNIGKVYGNSFTRNSRLKWLGRYIRITINQEKLRYKNKIIPLDGQFCFFNHSHFSNGNINDIRDRTFSAKKSDFEEELNEEFVISDIENIHNIITDVYFFKGRNVYLNIHDIKKTKDLCENYCKKWKIRFTIDDYYEKIINGIIKNDQFTYHFLT